MTETVPVQFQYNIQYGAHRTTTPSTQATTAMTAKWINPVQVHKNTSQSGPPAHRVHVHKSTIQSANQVNH